MITRYRVPLLLLLVSISLGTLWLSSTSAQTKIRAAQIYLSDVFAFSGNNTHSGTETFNGPLKANGGGILQGTFSGNPVLSSGRLALLNPTTDSFVDIFGNAGYVSEVAVGSYYGSSGQAHWAWDEPIGALGAQGTFYLNDYIGSVHPIVVSPTTDLVQLTSLAAIGTAATLTGTGACATITTQHGGSWAGDAKCTGTTGASTLTITTGITAPTGWVCHVQDETTRANLFQQTSNSQTACVLTVTSVTQNDVFVFSAVAY